MKLSNGISIAPLLLLGLLLTQLSGIDQAPTE